MPCYTMGRELRHWAIWSNYEVELESQSVTNSEESQAAEADRDLIQVAGTSIKQIT